MKIMNTLHKDDRGFFHLHLLSLSFFFLALVGAWHLYTSYKQNLLSNSMTLMLNDYKKLTVQAVTNAPDRQKIEKNIQEITSIISKTPGINLSTPSSSSKAFYYLDYPYSKK